MMTLVHGVHESVPGRRGRRSTKAVPPQWEGVNSTRTSLTGTAPPPPSEHLPAPDAPCRTLPRHVSASTLAFFKRKCVCDDEPIFNFRTYYQTAAPALEERSRVLRLSMEKMRFMDDPEAFLRRSVLVNNLLRRLRTDILLQSCEWPLPVRPFHALQQALPTHLCAAPPAGPPLCKRIRVVGGGGALSWYSTALSTGPSSPHASFFPLANHGHVAVQEDQNVEGEAEHKKRLHECSSNQESRTGPALHAVHTSPVDCSVTRGVQPEEEGGPQRNATEGGAQEECRASPQSSLVLTSLQPLPTH